MHDVLRVCGSRREESFGVGWMDGVWLGPFLGMQRHGRIRRVFFVVVGGDVIAISFDSRKTSHHFGMLGGEVCCRLGWTFRFGGRYESIGG